MSTRRAALVRVFAEGKGRKNDDVDAHSIALVALCTPDLPLVHLDDRAVTVRLLSSGARSWWTCAPSACVDCTGIWWPCWPVGHPSD